MLKSILLASAVMISAPAFAQDATPQEAAPVTQEQTAPPAAEPTAPEPAAPAEAPAPAEAQDQTAVDSTAQTAPAPAEPAAAAAEQPAQTAQQPAAEGKQPANATQIAQVVDSGFPTYDKDADGNLKAEEFGAWMVALRSASEPAFTGQSAADKDWITRAWAAADTDKSNGINKDELKGFLAPAAAS